MADILSALAELENEGKPKSKTTTKDVAARNAAKNAGPRPKSLSRPQSRRTSGASTKAPRPNSVPDPHLLAPNLGEQERGRQISYARSERSASQGPDSRRISFAEPSRPSGNKLWIPTIGESLATGFEYDPRLNKYSVSEREWHDFCAELVDAAAVPGPTWMWSFRKKDVIKRLNRDLQYDGEVKKVLKKWNRLFKRQRFQAYLELPGAKQDDFYGDDKEFKTQIKRFRVVITPNSERAPSVYSRTSSLTRSVTGEGRTAVDAHQVANELMKAQAERRDSDDDDS